MQAQAKGFIHTHPLGNKFIVIVLLDKEASTAEIGFFLRAFVIRHYLCAAKWRDGFRCGYFVAQFT